MHSESNATKLLRPSDVTREYHFTGPWLRKRRWLNLPPAFVRIGRMVYYERTKLDSFIESQRVEPNSVSTGLPNRKMAGKHGTRDRRVRGTDN